jgi:hypothetical protein
MGTKLNQQTMYDYYFDMFRFLSNNEIEIKQNSTPLQLTQATIKYALDRDTMDKLIPIDVYGHWWVLSDYTVYNQDFEYCVNYRRITWDQITHPDTGWIAHVSRKVESFDQENFIKAIYHAWHCLGKP